MTLQLQWAAAADRLLDAIAREDLDAASAAIEERGRLLARGISLSTADLDRSEQAEALLRVYMQRLAASYIRLESVRSAMDRFGGPRNGSYLNWAA